jgi:hypothetical protein
VPAVATTVGPLIELNASPAGEEQRAPSIAWDSVNQVYVIAFEDYRQQATNGADILVARLAVDPATGVVTINDPSGIGLPLGADIGVDQVNPAILFNGSTHAIVWQDSRFANDGGPMDPDGPDIFAARFFADTGLFFLAPSSVTGADSSFIDREPSLSWGNQRWLVAFERSNPMGITLQGRRLFPDLTADDAAPVTISGVESGGPPASAAIGPTHFVAWSDSSEVFIRTVTESGAIPAAPIALVGTSTRSSSVSLAPLGVGTVFATWRQRDTGPTGLLDSNVYGDRINATLASTGALGPLSQGANDELTPQVAGDSTGGVAIWQDFRNGVNSPAIYGAQIDATGTVVEIDGVLLITQTNGIAEPAIVKGPGNDFLVAGVRRQPSTAAPEERIFVRLVRAEPPCCMMDMVNVGDPNVAADGVDRASVVFDPAKGQSGLPVADETRYTMFVTSPDNPNLVPSLVVEPPDLDPATAGIQVAAEGGVVAFDLSSIERGTLDIDIQSDLGTQSGVASISFDNVAPRASNPVLRGVMSLNDRPRSVDSLEILYDFSDVNPGDTDMGTQIQWRKNTAVQGSLADQVVIPPAELNKGDTWTATVRPSDGISVGTATVSNTVLIINSPPFVEDQVVCEIGVPQDRRCSNNPGFDLRTDTQGIRAEFNPEDPDEPNDSVQSVEVRWFLDGNPRPDLDDQVEIPGTEITKGQTWRFEVRVSDEDAEFSEFFPSGEVTVNNTAPTALAGDNIDAFERAMVTLQGGGEDIDGDDLTFQWTQTQGLDVELDDPTSATPSFTAPSVALGTTLQFTLVVNDGDEDSPPDLVAVQVQALPDSDMDGLDDEQELTITGTDPNNRDTDNDGLRDGYNPADPGSLGEVNVLDGAPRSDPLDRDSDDDGVRDGNEGQPDPASPVRDPYGDADGDGMANIVDPDSDNDGILDGTENGRTTRIAAGGVTGFEYEGTDPDSPNFVADVDPVTTTDPTLADTDSDGFDDGVEDSNQNGAIDEGETDPNDPNDPGQACTGDGDCGTGEICDAGVCIPDPTPRECSVTLASRGFVCCNDGMTADPICPPDRDEEDCPAGFEPAQRCGAAPSSGGDSGGCRTGAGELWTVWLLVGAGWALGRRRRSVA